MVDESDMLYQETCVTHMLFLFVMSKYIPHDWLCTFSLKNKAFSNHAIFILSSDWTTVLNQMIWPHFKTCFKICAKV